MLLVDGDDGTAGFRVAADDNVGYNSGEGVDALNVFMDFFGASLGGFSRGYGLDGDEDGGISYVDTFFTDLELFLFRNGFGHVLGFYLELELFDRPSINSDSDNAHSARPIDF